MRTRERAVLRNWSAVRLRLRDVTLYSFKIAAEYSAGQTATSIVNVYLRNRVNVELLRDCSPPIDDINLAQGNLWIISRHLLEAWSQLPARAAPIRIKIDDRHIAGYEVLIHVDLRTVRNHLDRFAATGSSHRRLIDCLLCRISRGNRRVVMKTFLNILRQLDEIDFRDSRFRFQHNAVRLHPGNGDILVFFPANQ